MKQPLFPQQQKLDRLLLDAERTLAGISVRIEPGRSIRPIDIALARADLDHLVGRMADELAGLRSEILRLNGHNRAVLAYAKAGLRQ